MKFILLPIYAFLLSAGLYGQSFSIIDSLQNELKKNIPDSAKVYILTKIDWEYRATDKQKALDYANKALALATKINFTEGVGFSYMAIGNVYGYYNEYAMALENYNKALPFFEKINKDFRLAQLYDNFGYTYSEFDPEKAVAYLQKALDIYIKNKLVRDEGEIYNTLGGIYEDNMQLDKALEFWKKSLQIALKTNNYESAAIVCSNMYIVYKGLYEKYKQSHYLDSAQSFLNQGYQVVQNNEIEYKSVLPAILSNLGELYFMLGNTGKAIEYLNKSIELAIPIHYDDVLCESNGLLGEIFAQQKKFDTAADYFKKSLEAAQKTNVEYLSNTYERLYKFSVAKGDFKQAFNYQTLYISAKDSLYNTQKTQAVNNLQIKYETEKKEQQIQYLQKENGLKHKTNKALILLSVLLVGVSLLIYRNFKLKKKVFAQKEKLLKEEKEVSVLQSKIEEKAKEDALLKLQLQHQEQKRLQQEIDFKHRELTANMLQIEQKNELLSDLKSQLQNIESNNKTLNLNLKKHLPAY
jgi:two-component system NarL family sensor kinase